MAQDNVTDVVIPMLQKLQADMSGMRGEMTEMKEEQRIIKDAVRRIDTKMSAVESYQAGMYSMLRVHTDDIDDLRGRVEAIERIITPPHIPPTDTKPPTG